MRSSDDTEPTLPRDVAMLLVARGQPSDGGMAQRRALEARVFICAALRLMPAAAHRWQARYRLMTANAYRDGAGHA